MAMSAFADAEGVKDVANLAKEVQLRAERKAGEFLRDMPGKGEHGGDRKSSDTMSLEEMGITKKQSSRWQLAAELPEESFEQIIDMTKKHGQELTSKAIRDAARKLRTVETVETPPLPEGKFNLIYADPPWRYEFASSPNRRVENQLSTMPYEDIARLPVQEITHNDCVLFLWVPAPKLEEAFWVMDFCGFMYRTNMVWVKDKIGIGYSARLRFEYFWNCSIFSRVCCSMIGT